MTNPLRYLYTLTSLILLVWPVANALASPLLLDAQPHALSLAPHLVYRIADSADPASAGDDDGWQTTAGTTLNLGYRLEPLWIRVDFSTGDLPEQHWILEAANSQLDDIRVYLLHNGEPVQQWHSGDRQPFAERPIDHRHFLFPLTLAPQQHYRLLIYIHNTEAMEVPLQLSRQAVFLADDSLRASIDGAFYGILLVIAAYSFMVYLILRDPAYLYYVSYVVSMLLFFLWQHGVLYQVLFPTLPLVQKMAAPHLSLLIFGSIALFFRSFLHLPQRVPRLWLAYKALLILHCFLCLLMWLLPYQTVIGMMVVSTVASTLLAMISIVPMALAGQRPAQIVLTGWALLLLCLLFLTAAKSGVIYNDFMAQYGLRLGISFEILIFSFALAFRINEERDEKERALQQVDVERNERMRAQELALDAEKEASRLKEAALQAQKAHSEHLQRLVEERTADLENTLTNLEQAHRELERLSILDGLTGVLNRRAFDEKLTELWASAQRQRQPLSVLMVDIDHFKQINDSLGHPCGDYVLKAFSQLLGSLLQRPSDVLARYGGEEFAILLPDTPLAGAEVVAAAIIERMQQHPYQWHEHRFTITASIGLSCQVPQPDAGIDDLVAQADQALYLAKRDGRNRWASHPDAASPRSGNGSQSHA